VLAAGRHPASLHGRPRSTGARPHRSPRERFSLECDSRLAAPSSATPGLRLPRGSRSRGRLRALPYAERPYAERPHAERPHAERDAPSDEATSDLMTTSHSPSRQSFEAPPRSFVRRTVRPFDLLTARPSDHPTVQPSDHWIIGPTFRHTSRQKTIVHPISLSYFRFVKVLVVAARLWWTAFFVEEIAWQFG
jgi:hypothetical protein